MKKCLYLLGILFVLPTQALPDGPTQTRRQVNDRERVERLVQPFIKDKPFIGLVVGITRPEGQQVYGYGGVVVDGKKQAPGPDTLFEIGSVTKTFTGTLLAELVVAGKVRLDDPVQKWLPDGLTLPTRDGRQITLLNLATHSSSLPRDFGNLGLSALFKGNVLNPFATITMADLKNKLPTFELEHPIGCRADYSNLGVGLLGHALCRPGEASSYEELLKKNLTGPLSLKDTAIHLSPEQKKRFPPCHMADGKETPQWTFGCLEACGGLHSTAHDMLRYAEVNMGRVKTPLAGACRLAQQPWRDWNSGDRYVGLCWLRRSIGHKGYTMIWHNGATYGARAFVGMVPARGIAVVVLNDSANATDALAIKLVEELVDAK